MERSRRERYLRNVDLIYTNLLPNPAGLFYYNFNSLRWICYSDFIQSCRLSVFIYVFNNFMMNFKWGKLSSHFVGWYARRYRYKFKPARKTIMYINCLHFVGKKTWRKLTPHDSSQCIQDAWYSVLIFINCTMGAVLLGTPTILRESSLK